MISFRFLRTVTGILFSLTSLQSLADEAAIHKNFARIESRVLGAPLNPKDPLRLRMVEVVKAADEKPSSYQEASQLLIEHDGLYRNSLFNLFASMQNISQDPRAVTILNRPVAMLLAKAAAGDIRPAFYANETCSVQVGTATIDPNRITAAQYSGVNLKSAFVCSPGQPAVAPGANNDDPPISIPSDDVAGFMTLNGREVEDAFAGSAFFDGTNRRGVQLKMSYLPGGLEGHRSTEFTDARIHVDVSRDPSGLGYAYFREVCASCHGLIDAIVSATCLHISYDDNDGIIYNANPNLTRNKCIGSNPPNTTNFPAGHQPRTKEWEVLFTAAQRTTLGDTNESISGTGFNSLARYWTNLKGLYQGLLERAQSGSVGVCPNVELSKTKVEQYASSFMADGNIARMVLKLASDPQCLGI